LLRQAVDPELVARVRTDDGDAQALRELTRAAGVVNVRVREPDLRGLDAQAPGFGKQLINVAARVDERRLVRGVAPERWSRFVLKRRSRGWCGGGAWRVP